MSLEDLKTDFAGKEADRLIGRYRRVHLEVHPRAGRQIHDDHHGRPLLPGKVSVR